MSGAACSARIEQIDTYVLCPTTVSSPICSPLLVLCSSLIDSLEARHLVGVHKLRKELYRYT